MDAAGNLWVAEGAPAAISAGTGPLYWSVFDPDGVRLGRVAAPRQLRLESIGEDYAIGIWRYGDDTGDGRVYPPLKPGAGDPR